MTLNRYMLNRAFSSLILTKKIVYEYCGFDWKIGGNSIGDVRVDNPSVLFNRRSFLIKCYCSLTDFAYFLQHTKENIPDTIYTLLQH